MYITAQIIGFIAFIISLLAYHKKEKSKILSYMAVYNILSLIHYILLDAYSGCITKIIAIIRNYFIVLKEKYKKLDSNVFLVLFILVYILVAIFTYTNVLSLFPLISGMIYIIPIWNGSELTVKKTAFATYFLWLGYNIFVSSISGCVSNIVSIISTFIAIINYNKNKEPKVQENSTIDIDYEEELLQKNGMISKKMFNRDIRLLVIADAHGTIHFHEDLISEYKDSNYDLCCILGDVTEYDYEVILKYIPKEKIVALLGNHDKKDVIDKFDLYNLNGNTIVLNGVRIGGIQGSHKYKNEDYPMYTHEESIELLDSMETVDILLSHDKPFTIDTGDNVHDGLKGITKYIYDRKVPINIHGHLHKSSLTNLKNGTCVKCVYLCELVEIKNGEIVNGEKNEI